MNSKLSEAGKKAAERKNVMAASDNFIGQNCGWRGTYYGKSIVGLSFKNLL
jgi:hypothetical protein